MTKCLWITACVSGTFWVLGRLPISQSIFFLGTEFFFSIFFFYFRKTYSFYSTNLETWASIKIESVWSCCVQQPLKRTWGDFCFIIFGQQLARSNLHKILDSEFGLTFPKTFCERQGTTWKKITWEVKEQSRTKATLPLKIKIDFPIKFLMRQANNSVLSLENVLSVPFLGVSITGISSFFSISFGVKNVINSLSGCYLNLCLCVTW